MCIRDSNYAVKNDLLSLPGWKRLGRIRNQKKLERMTNQSKLRSVRRAPIYKFGVQVPRNSREARVLDPKYQYKWTGAEEGVAPGMYESSGRMVVRQMSHWQVSLQTLTNCHSLDGKD